MDSRCEKLVPKRRAVQETKPVIVVDKKKSPTTVMANTQQGHTEDVKTGLGVTSEKVDQTELPTQASNQKQAQSTTHYVLPKETKLTAHIRLEQGLNPKLPEDKEDKYEAITSVVRTQKSEQDHEFNPEPNNKWKPKIEQRIVHAISKYEQTVLATKVK
ncbi:unnamed protein product [Arabis nemorensis]|uniref:Uncharacterized protein n=1 Tax=Arabis nemorensis TaxID=586526 RepID=A0A565BBV6_9BRAS|nr:unnamed protein product [Arabis nemorensis]